MSRSLTPLIAGLALLVGFAAARLSDLRWIGGVTVLAGAAWCVVRERRQSDPTPWWRLGLVLVVGAGCFVLSHLLADPLGPWPSVLLASVVLAAATGVLVAPRPAD